ncbi:MAG: glutathione S-transferase [Pseudomonadota bacterium]
MQLYYASSSPYARKVTVTLHETGQFHDVDLVPVYGSPTDPQTMPVAKNPLGKLPTLDRSDGPAIYDSRVICRYLNDRAEARLYPDAPRLWDTLTLEATGDGILDAALAMVYEVRLRPEDIQFADVIEGQWAKIDRALDVLNERWISHLSARLDIGQIAVGCALGYLDFRLEDRDWRKGRDALAGWYATFAERPSMQATQPVNPPQLS